MVADSGPIITERVTPKEAAPPPLAPVAITDSRETLDATLRSVQRHAQKARIADPERGEDDVSALDEMLDECQRSLHAAYRLADRVVEEDNRRSLIKGVA